MCPGVPNREIKMGEIEENWQAAKFYCSEIKLIYSRSFGPNLGNFYLNFGLFNLLIRRIDVYQTSDVPITRSPTAKVVIHF